MAAPRAMVSVPVIGERRIVWAVATRGDDFRKSAALPETVTV
jgi:hypothetical protein